MQIHLKPNFQYRLRGTKYSIPAPKAGSAKGGPGTGLILREDQVEYMRAKKMSDSKREREETRMMKGIISKGVDSRGVNAGVSSWMDPDWMPEIISVGAGGKGRTTRNSRMDGDMPQIGYGKKNPNERRRKK
jgi:RNA-binding protein NOB1